MFSVGDKVKYIGDSHGNATGSPFEPDVVGTVGIITRIVDRMTIRVRWPEDATRNGRAGRVFSDEYYTSEDRLELFDEQQICVGDDVEFIDQTVKTVRDPLCMFPPIGTIGTVVGIREDGALKVMWPSGTTIPSAGANGCVWNYCMLSRVRKCSPRQDVNKELDTLFSEFEVQ